MGQNFQWQQYLFIAVFMAFSVGSWVFGAVRQQAKRKRARAAARSRFEEQLRTGRSEEPEPTRASAPS